MRKPDTWGDITLLVAAEGQIIQRMSNIIDRLFCLLLQHISAEEAGSLPEVAELREIRHMCDSIGVDIGDGEDSYG